MTTKARRPEAPDGFRWGKSPTGMDMLFTDMRTRKGKRMLELARRIINEPDQE